MQYTTLIGIIVIAGILAAILPKSNSSKKKPTNEIHKTVEALNTNIMMYNQLQRQFVEKYNYINPLAIKYNDAKSMGDIAQIYDAYKKVVEKAGSEIDYIKDNLYETEDINKINSEIDKLSDYLTQMKIIISNISAICPRENTFYENFKNYNNNWNDSSSRNKKTSFFEGCSNKEEADKRYKALAKAFHPDVSYGSETLFKEMQDEYNSLKF